MDEREKLFRRWEYFGREVQSLASIVQNPIEVDDNTINAWLTAVENLRNRFSRLELDTSAYLDSLKK